MTCPGLQGHDDVTLNLKSPCFTPRKRTGTNTLTPRACKRCGMRLLRLQPMTGGYSPPRRSGLRTVGPGLVPGAAPAELYPCAGKPRGARGVRPRYAREVGTFTEVPARRPTALRTGVQDGTFKQHPGFIASWCSGSAAKVPVRDPTPHATICVGDSGRSQRVRRAHNTRITPTMQRTVKKLGRTGLPVATAAWSTPSADDVSAEQSAPITRGGGL